MRASRILWVAASCFALMITALFAAAPVHALNAAKQESAEPFFVNQANLSLPFDVQFQPQFTAKITNKRTKAVTYIDLRPGKTKYIATGIYDRNGKLLRPVTGHFDQLHMLVPVLQPDGTYRYEGRQTLWGTHNSDRIATAVSVWSRAKQSWKLVDVKLLPNDWKHEPYPPVWINTAFTIEGDNTYLLDAKRADVTGDSTPDHVLLVGYKEGSAFNLFAEQLRVVLRDGKTNEQTVWNVGKIDRGYMPTISIGAYNADRVIYVTMPNGGSGGKTMTSMINVQR